MVTISNNWISVSSDDPSYNVLLIDLKFIEPSKERRLKGGRVITIPPKTNYVYHIENNTMFIPVGLLDLLDPYFNNSKIIDKREDSVYYDKSYTDDIIRNISNYKDILPGITLREEQILSIRKIIYKKRCLAQLVTGSGKTEIMCALTKILYSVENIMPTVLILEPTKKLVSDTIRRFKNYGIMAVDYSENRYILNNCVNICHPKSLCNDINKDSNLLDSVEIMFGDECHHLRSNTFRTPTYNMSNLVYSVGLSASAIDQSHISAKKLQDYSFDELLVIGATGPLVINIKAKSMLGDKLADPILMVFNNKANEYIKQSDIFNWHEVLHKRLESNNRNKLISNISNFFFIKNRKILILVRTKSHARAILQDLHQLGLSEYSRASYGGGYFEKYNGIDYEQDCLDIFENYNKGKYKILIGTQHLIEGVDVPNLDVVVLAYVGKNEKVLVQSIGRVLRKTKTGKYAYIIDFNDYEDIILSNHYRIRLNKYENIIGVPTDHMYIGMEIEDLPSIFSSLEN